MGFKKFKYDSQMDDFCNDLCDAINNLPYCTTIESCNGHLKGVFSIWVMTSCLHSISILSRLLDKRYSVTQIPWKIELETMENMWTEPGFVLMVHSEYPYNDYETMKRDTDALTQSIYYFLDNFKSEILNINKLYRMNNIEPIWNYPVKMISDEIREEVKNEISDMDIKPKLAVIIVGKDPASQVYVRNKSKACEKAGIENLTVEMDENTTEDDVISKVNELNEDSTVDGILVQLPLPKGIDEHKVINSVDPRKDVDGFTDCNQARLWNRKWTMDDYQSAPCTPLGVIYILDRIRYDVTGKHICIIGRSNTVGKPLAKMLEDMDATVTVCNSKTLNISNITLNSDVIISAVGKPHMVTSDMVKNGAIIIDVGINRVNGKLCGDVDYEDVAPKCRYITPVPGGVGLMTVSTLIKKTLLFNKGK